MQDGEEESCAEDREKEDRGEAQHHEARVAQDRPEPEDRQDEDVREANDPRPLQGDGRSRALALVGPAAEREEEDEVRSRRSGRPEARRQEALAPAPTWMTIRISPPNAS